MNNDDLHNDLNERFDGFEFEPSNSNWDKIDNDLNTIDENVFNFESVFSDHEETPSSNVWDNIEKELHPRKKRLVYWVSGAAACVIAVLMIQPKPSNPIQTSQTNISENQFFNIVTPEKKMELLQENKNVFHPIKIQESEIPKTHRKQHLNQIAIREKNNSIDLDKEKSIIQKTDYGIGLLEEFEKQKLKLSNSTSTAKNKIISIPELNINSVINSATNNNDLAKTNTVALTNTESIPDVSFEQSSQETGSTNQLNVGSNIVTISNNNQESQEADMSFSNNPQPEYETFLSPPISVGADFSKKITSKTFMNFGIGYSYQFQSIINNAVNVSSKKDMHFIVVPIEIQRSLTQKKKYKLITSLGGQLNYLVANKTTNSGVIPSPESLNEFNIPAFGFSFIYGLGTLVKLNENTHLKIQPRLVLPVNFQTKSIQILPGIQAGITFDLK